MAGRFDLQVQVQAHDDLPQISDEARAMLFRTARELLINCAKHAGAGRAQLTLEALDDRVILTVADQGSGFDPQATEQGSSGGGFGLFSIRERVELLNGTCTIASSPGSGTVVTVALPVASLKAEAKAEPPAASNERRPREPITDTSGKRIRIMLVDDHAMVRGGIAAMLDDEPDCHVVAEAADAAQAIEMLNSVPVDVVLMDVNMPGMNGIEATRLITSSPTPPCVIGMSMHDPAEMASAMKKAGASAYLSKDAPPAVLLQTVRAVIGPGELAH